MAEWRIGRALLDVPETDEGDVVTDYAAEEDMAHDDTQTLRIVSIFVILAAGLLGGLPPLFIKVGGTRRAHGYLPPSDIRARLVPAPL